MDLSNCSHPQTLGVFFVLLTVDWFYFWLLITTYLASPQQQQAMTLGKKSGALERLSQEREGRVLKSPLLPLRLTQKPVGKEINKRINVGTERERERKKSPARLENMWNVTNLPMMAGLMTWTVDHVASAQGGGENFH